MQTKFMCRITTLTAICFIMACSPKTKEVIQETVEPTFVLNDPSKPCRTLNDLPSQQREDAENAFVIYKDQMNFKKWDQALQIWKQAYQLAPGSNGKIVGHFSDGISIYSELSKATSDNTLKAKYLDTIKMINAKYEQCFTVDATQMARRAFDYYYNLGDIMPESDQWNTFTKAIEMNNGKMIYFIVNPFTKLLYDRVVAGQISAEEGRKYANMIFKNIDEGSKNCKGTECEGWETIKSYAPDRLEALEGIDDFYDCKYYSDKYYAQFRQYPDSCEIIVTAYARMLRGKCDINDSRLLEVKAARTAKCTPAVPVTTVGPLRQAYDAYGDGKYKEAISLFETYISNSTDPAIKFKYTMLIAKIYYGDLRNYPQSRRIALEATKYNSKSGEPYLLIGKLYASSGPLCGPGRGFDSQVVTWPAIDKFIQARNLDSEVAPEANKMINQYSKYMPKMEDIFLRNIAKGSGYTVGCWIQERTTVRTAD
jgi:tetratricopeptide (TPR) repeat protein